MLEEIRRTPPDLIATNSVTWARRLTAVNGTIPILIAALSPVEHGLVASLARPDGNDGDRHRRWSGSVRCLQLDLLLMWHPMRLTSPAWGRTRPTLPAAALERRQPARCRRPGVLLPGSLRARAWRQQAAHPRAAGDQARRFTRAPLPNSRGSTGFRSSARFVVLRKRAASCPTALIGMRLIDVSPPMRPGSSMGRGRANCPSSNQASSNCAQPPSRRASRPELSTVAPGSGRRGHRTRGPS